MKSGSDRARGVSERPGRYFPVAGDPAPESFFRSRAATREDSFAMDSKNFKLNDCKNSGDRTPLEGYISTSGSACGDLLGHPLASGQRIVGWEDTVRRCGKRHLREHLHPFGGGSFPGLRHGTCVACRSFSAVSVQTFRAAAATARTSRSAAAGGPPWTALRKISRSTLRRIRVIGSSNGGPPGTELERSSSPGTCSR